MYIDFYVCVCVREGVKLRLDSNNDLTRFKYNRPMRTYNLAYTASLGAFVFTRRARGSVATSSLLSLAILQNYFTKFSVAKICRILSFRI